MLKKDEAADPTSCFNQAADDEMVFVLRAKDPAASSTIAFWAQQRVTMGLNKPDDPKIKSALLDAKIMLEGHSKPSNIGIDLASGKDFSVEHTVNPFDRPRDHPNNE